MLMFLTFLTFLTELHLEGRPAICDTRAGQESLRYQERTYEALLYPCCRGGWF